MHAIIRSKTFVRGTYEQNNVTDFEEISVIRCYVENIGNAVKLRNPALSNFIRNERSVEFVSVHLTV